MQARGWPPSSRRPRGKRDKDAGSEVCKRTRATEDAVSRRLSARLANHQVDELAWHDDLLDDLPAVDVRPHVGSGPAEVLQRLRARVGARLHAVADLAVDLADQLVDLALEQG